MRESSAGLSFNFIAIVANLAKVAIIESVEKKGGPVSRGENRAAEWVDCLCLFGNATLFDACLLAGELAQVVKFCATHFTVLVDSDAVDER